MFHAFRVVGEGARRAGGRFRGFRFAAFVFGWLRMWGRRASSFSQVRLSVTVALEWMLGGNFPRKYDTP